MPVSPIEIRVHEDIQKFKDRKQAVVDLCDDIVTNESITISIANARIDDALKARDMTLGKIGAEFIDYMSEHYALEEPVVAPAAETAPAEAPTEKVRRARAPRAAKPPEVTEAPIVLTEVWPGAPATTSVRLVEDIVIPEPEILDRATTPPEVATAVIPTRENPNGTVRFTGQGPVVEDAVIAPAKDVVVEVLPFEHWKKTMPTFTKSGGIINLLKSQPPEAWPVLRRAESAGLNRDSILRLIDAHVLDHEALARKSAAASATLAPLDDTDPPF
jgi:hypothetical protein